MRIVPRSVHLRCQCGIGGCQGGITFDAPSGLGVVGARSSSHTGERTSSIVLNEIVLRQLRQYLDDIEVQP